MSGFRVVRTVVTEDGKVVKDLTETFCIVCRARLESAPDWSRHRSMHTISRMSPEDRQWLEDMVMR